MIFLGTFSKILSPGLRLGWTIAPAGLAEKLVLLKQGTDQCSNTLGQMIALECGRLGLIERQIAVTTASLEEKKRITLAALDRELGTGASSVGFDRTDPEGGSYTWVALPSPVDTARMLERAVTRHKVAYVAGPAFYVRAEDGLGRLRVCYSLVPAGLIEEGIRRLAAAWLEEGGQHRQPQPGA